mgnify:FL=1
MIAIWKHELRSYFHSLTAYVFGAFLLLVVGLGAMLYNLQAAVSNFEFVLSFSSLVFVVIVPILTMRVIAEERRQKTDQLLYALPITTAQVILGKYLALLAVYLAPLGIISFYPLIFAQFGEVYLPTAYGSILAFFLLGAVEIAVGMLISSLTESQIIAAVGTFGLLLLLYLWDGLVGFLPSTAVGSLLGFFVVLILVCFLINALSNNWKVTAGVLVAGAAVLIAFYLRDSSVFANLLPDVLGKFSLLSAFDSFSTDHVFDVPGILLYLSISALLVFLTVQVIQKRRWN